MLVSRMSKEMLIEMDFVLSCSFRDNRNVTFN